jgi:cytochrome oxidase Cu insertion factor (SCO1/SenC/PrrC family)
MAVKCLGWTFAFLLGLTLMETRFHPLWAQRISYQPKSSGVLIEDLVFLTDDSETLRLNDWSEQGFLLVPFFSLCPSTCSLLVPQVRELLQRVEHPWKVLAVSLDPLDTAADLKNFRQVHRLDDSWTLVRGSQFDLQRLFAPLEFTWTPIGERNFAHPTLFYVVGRGLKVSHSVAGLSPRSSDLENSWSRSALIPALSGFVLVLLALVGFSVWRGSSKR